MITTLLVREGFTKKSSRSFGFCSNYLDPPTPQFGQLVPLFLNANVAKNLGRGLPLPAHPQIDPIYTVCEKWTKSKKTAIFSGDLPQAFINLLAKKYREISTIRKRYGTWELKQCLIIPMFLAIFSLWIVSFLQNLQIVVPNKFYFLHILRIVIQVVQGIHIWFSGS